MQRPGCLLLVVALVVLAGCNVGGVDEGRAPVTPAAVPSDKPRAAPSTAETGTVETLLARHERRLAGRSFSVELVLETNTTEADTFRERQVVRRAMVDGDRRLDRQSVTWFAPDGSGDPDVSVQYVEGDDHVTRRVDDGSVDFDVSASLWSPASDQATATVRQLLAGGEPTVDRVRTTGGRRLVVETTTPPAGWNTTRFYARLVVDDAGLVEQFDASYVRRVSGATVAVETSVDFHDVGETSVERPSWYGPARDDASNATARAALDDASAPVGS